MERIACSSRSRLQNFSALTLKRYGSELAALEVPLGELARVSSGRGMLKKDDKNGIDWI